MGADLIAHFGRLGSKCVELEPDERLRIFHDFYRAGEETEFRFDIIGLIDIPTEDEIKSLMAKIKANPQEYRLTA